MEDIIHFLGSFAFWASGLGFIAITTIYGIWSRWNEKPIGQAIMGVFSSISLIYLLLIVRIFTMDSVVWEYVRTVVFTILSIAIWTLAFALLRIQRRERKQRDYLDEQYEAT